MSLRGVPSCRDDVAISILDLTTVTKLKSTLDKTGLGNDSQKYDISHCNAPVLNAFFNNEGQCPMPMRLPGMALLLLRSRGKIL
jgi:hypothetical protein